MKSFVIILVALLASCSKHSTDKSKDASVSEEELSKIMKLVTERHAPLLAAKYKLPTETAQAIVSDFRVHQFLLMQALTSPPPRVETMEQTIQRLSQTYKLSTDVIASIIFDDLLLEQTLDEH